MAARKPKTAAVAESAPIEAEIAEPKKARAKKKVEAVAAPAPEAAPVVVEAAAPAPIVAAPVVAPAHRKVTPTRQQVARRAFELWRAGSTDSVANWFAAENELRA